MLKYYKPLSSSPEEKVAIPTPFGAVSLPLPERPTMAPPEPPEIDDRRMAALRHVVAIDLSGIVGWIPVVGDVVADVVEDLHGSELHRILTPEEYDRYLVEDKVAPSFIAMIRTFMKVPLKGE